MTPITSCIVTIQSTNFLERCTSQQHLFTTLPTETFAVNFIWPIKVSSLYANSNYPLTLDHSSISNYLPVPTRSRVQFSNSVQSSDSSILSIPIQLSDSSILPIPVQLSDPSPWTFSAPSSTSLLFSISAIQSVW